MNNQWDVVRDTMAAFQSEIRITHIVDQVAAEVAAAQICPLAFHGDSQRKSGATAHVD